MRDPDARNGKMWASRAAAGRNGRGVRGVDGAAVGKLGSYAGDCGPFVCEGCVGGNKVSSRAGVEDSWGFWRGGSII